MAVAVAAAAAMTTATLLIIVYAAVSAAVAFLVVSALTPPLIRLLEGRSMAVRDVNKKGRVMVARPGGPAIVAGMVASEAVLYAFLQLDAILAVIATTSAAFAVGYIDDRRVMGGWFKPAALAVAALPILAIGAYDTDLVFPLFGPVHIPVLYAGLVLSMIVITGNTVNSIDILNGVASGFMAIAGFSLTACLVVLQNYPMALVSLPLGFVSLAFYRYHRLPSRIFPGDSGALALGAMYGAVAIAGGVEVLAAIALLPAILNSFLFLSSMKRIVEHRQVKGAPVKHNSADDLRLRATDDRDAPVTLLRLILAGSGPLSERQAAMAIFRLAAFLGIVAVCTAAMMAMTMAVTT